MASGKSGALRAAIFGVNDGLVSNLSLIFGVAGAGVDNSVVIVAGVAGLLAGAFSMAAGEYISVRVQREVYERLIHLEAHEIGSDPEAERLELAELYVRKGLPRDLSDRLATELMRDPQVALETHAREELGLDPKEGLGSPFAAAGSSFVTFALGAFVPLLPFLVSSGTPAVVASAILSGIALFARRRRDVVPHGPSLAAVGVTDARRRGDRGRRHATWSAERSTSGCSARRDLFRSGGVDDDELIRGCDPARRGWTDRPRATAAPSAPCRSR